MSRPATYFKNAAGLTRSEHFCSCHGRSFPSREIMRLHVREYKKRVLKDLELMVKEGTLGQKAWERLPGESPIAYNHFKVYLSSTLNPATGDRSYKAAAVIIGRDVVAIGRMAARFKWSLRAQLFDKHIDQEELQVFTRNKVQSAYRQAGLGRKLQEAAMVGAKRILSDPERELSGNEVAKLADVGVKIERLANMDPTKITEDRGVSVLWEGPRPDWAPTEEDHNVRNVTHQPLTDKVVEGK